MNEIKESPPVDRLTPALAWVEKAYAALEASSGITVRRSQVELSNELVRCVLGGLPLAAEAPTGTGKTLAYLIGSLATSRQLAGEKPVPVVVATATKALQDQILHGDFPKLVKAGLAQDGDAVVMKGKSTYICIRDAVALHEQLAAHALDAELFIDEDAPYVEPAALDKIISLYDSKQWGGELDQVRNVDAKQLSGISVNSDTCAKKRCPRYLDCAYYRAKDRVRLAKVVITNQDLLLRDLALTVESTTAATLDIPNYIAIIDEAHHLPNKALAVGSSEIQLVTLLNSLQKLQGLTRTLADSKFLQSKLVAADFKADVLFDSESAFFAAKRLSERLAEEEVDAQSNLRRFPRGTVPDDILAQCTEVGGLLSSINLALTAFLGLVRESKPPSAEKEAKLFSEALRRASSLASTLGKAEKGLSRFATSSLRGVRWMARSEHASALFFSPLEGAQVLRPLLWKNERARPVLVSATLKGLDNFKRFAAASGLPPEAVRISLPHVFDYSQNTLTVVGMAFSPKPAERSNYLVELERELISRIDPNEGTLLILQSWAVLKVIAPALKQAFGYDRVRVQGETSVKALIESHKQALDIGAGSILVGVATMAEGLDLPGKYCTHVCIAALPFAVPDSPVEKEVSDMLGAAYFSQRSLPHATLVLIQEVGRLIRRESDRGRVTMFDHRLGSTKYGKEILRALPPFKIVIEPSVATPSARQVTIVD